MFVCFDVYFHVNQKIWKKFKKWFTLFRFGRGTTLIVPSLFSNLVNACQSNKSLYQCYEIDTQTHANCETEESLNIHITKCWHESRRSLFSFFFHLIRCFRHYNNRLNYLFDCITHNGNALSRFWFYYLLFKWDCVCYEIEIPLPVPEWWYPQCGYDGRLTILWDFYTEWAIIRFD